MSNTYYLPSTFLQLLYREKNKKDNYSLQLAWIFLVDDKNSRQFSKNLRMARDSQGPSDDHSHQKPIHILDQSVQKQDFYSQKPPIIQKDYQVRIIGQSSFNCPFVHVKICRKKNLLLESLKFWSLRILLTSGRLQVPIVWL